MSNINKNILKYLDDTTFNHLVVKIVTLTGSLSHTGEHGVTTVVHGDVVNQFHDNDLDENNNNNIMIRFVQHTDLTQTKECMCQEMKEYRQTEHKTTNIFKTTIHIQKMCNLNIKTYRLSDTSTTEKSDLSTLSVGGQQIHNLNTSHKNLLCLTLLGEERSGSEGILQKVNQNDRQPIAMV